MLYLLYLLLASFFTCAGYFMEHGEPTLLLQPAELVIICFPSLFFAVAATSWRAFGESWRLVFGNPVKPDMHLVRQACRYLRVFGYSCIFMGLVACFLGLVVTLGALDQPTKIIGEHFGASIVALIHAFMLRLLCYVAEQRIKGRYLEIEAARQGS